MVNLRRFFKALLVAAYASAFLGCGGASAQVLSRIPLFSPNMHLQFGSPPAPSTTTHAGTIQVTFNITVKSPPPPAPQGFSMGLWCEADVVASDASYANTYYEAQAAQVLINNSTTTTTCSVSIPYQWSMGHGGGYAVWYSIYQGLSSPSRVTQRYAISADKFPQDGQTTNYTFNVTF